MICHCGTYVADTLKHCPTCGSFNPVWSMANVRATNKTDNILPPDISEKRMNYGIELILDIHEADVNMFNS